MKHMIRPARDVIQAHLDGHASRSDVFRWAMKLRVWSMDHHTEIHRAIFKMHSTTDERRCLLEAKAILSNLLGEPQKVEALAA